MGFMSYSVRLNQHAKYFCEEAGKNIPFSPILGDIAEVVDRSYKFNSCFTLKIGDRLFPHVHDEGFISLEADRYNLWLKNLGQNLKKIRSTKDLTQQQMANLLLLNLKYYQDVEAGRQPLTCRTLHKISHGIGISVSELVEETHV